MGIPNDLSAIFNHDMAIIFITAVAKVEKNMF
jgi:hypothetical protein